jgi:hypothetical protein
VAQALLDKDLQVEMQQQQLLITQQGAVVVQVQ